MTLMRGLHVEEPVVEVKEEEKIGFSRVYPALPASPDDSGGQVKPFSEGNADENGQ